MTDVFQKQICAARIVFTILFAAFLFIATAPSASAGPILGPDLSAFAILGGAGVTFDGATSGITGSVGGCCHAVAITGAIPTNYTDSGGTVYLAADPATTNAQNELGIAMTALAGMTAGASEATLDNITLGPGVYSVSATDLNTVLTLDGGGNANALWVFQFTSALTTASNSKVILENTGAGAGVYWVMATSGGSATLGSSSTFVGNILAYAAITVGTTATDSCGRLLTQTESVTLDGTDTIGIGCSGLPGSNGLSGGGTLSMVGGVPVIATLAPSYVPEPSAFFCLAPCLAGLVIQRKLARSKLAKSRA
jgi:hypothetical protein